jgi:ABC-type transporter Mla subunit MlaD
MFEAFENLEKTGKQVVEFINNANQLLSKMAVDIQSLKDEMAAHRAEFATLKEHVAKVEDAHTNLLNWLAEIDNDEMAEVAAVVTDAAATAVEASAVATEAAAIATESVVAETIEDESMTETTEKPVEEVKTVEEIKPVESKLEETPVPSDKAESNESKEKPAKRANSRRSWI